MATKAHQRQIKELLNAAKQLNEDDTMSEQEFLKAFKAVTSSFNILKANILEKLESAKLLMKQGLQDVKKAKTEDVDKIEKRITKALEKMERQLSNELNFINDKVSKIEDGTDGANADEDAIVEKLKKLIPEFPEEITNTIKDLEVKNEKQQEEIEELKLRPIGRGGGTSAMGVAQTFKYIAHTEEPVGLINGSNKVYTVKVDIWWIAGFTLNGENIAELPNYTFINKVITFSSALPSSYSGKDFECKYIG